MLVVDTNVVSELMKATPRPEVMSWVQRLPTAETFTASVTVAEIRYGIERLPPGRRRTSFEAAADDIFSSFGDRILPFDLAAAVQFGFLAAHKEQIGAPMSTVDAQIAAICMANGASLATRNVRDFHGSGVELVNPWDVAIP